MKQILSLLTILIVVISCNNSNVGYKKAKNGILYKVIPGKNVKDSFLKVGDGIAYTLIEKLGDSTGSNSYEQGHQLTKVDTVINDPFSFMFVFSKMKVGDSAHIKLSTDTIYKTIISANKRRDPAFNEADFKKKLPKFILNKGKYIEFGVKVIDRFEIDRTKPNYLKDSLRLVEFNKVQGEVAKVFQTKLMDKAKKQDSVNMEAGKKFLDKNKSVQGVITTASGLQYQIIKEGTGPKPVATDDISCHYIGTNLAGVEFDNSLKRKAPAQFNVSGVVPGWTEVLQLMNVGSKYKVWIPGNLGYGAMGNQGIEPGQLLVFEMELLEILKKNEQDASKSAQGHSAGDGHDHGNQQAPQQYDAKQSTTPTDKKTQ